MTRNAISSSSLTRPVPHSGIVIQRSSAVFQIYAAPEVDQQELITAASTFGDVRKEPGYLQLWFNPVYDADQVVEYLTALFALPGELDEDEDEDEANGEERPFPQIADLAGEDGGAGEEADDAR